MKLKNYKRTALLISAVMAVSVFTGCGSKGTAKAEPVITDAPEETAAIATPVPTVTPIPEPETEEAIVLANGYKIVYSTLKRGESVKIAGEEGDYYRINYGEDFRGNDTVMLVEKDLIRTESTEIEPYTVYAKSKAQVCSNAYLTDVIYEPEQNAELTVTDEMNGILYVAWVDADTKKTENGYVNSADVSETYIQSYYYDYGGSSGGDSGSSYGYDGGDIAAGDLMRSKVDDRPTGFANLFLTVAFADDDIPETGIVFSDDTEVYLDILSYGETINVIPSKTPGKAHFDSEVYLLGDDGKLASETRNIGSVTVFVNNCIVEVPPYVLRMNKTTADVWEGYVQSKVNGYENYDLTGEETALDTNAKVTVDTLETGILIITLHDEDADEDLIFYVTPDGVKDTEYVQPYYDWSDYGGGGGSSEVVAEWSEPVL